MDLDLDVHKEDPAGISSSSSSSLSSLSSLSSVPSSSASSPMSGGVSRGSSPVVGGKTKSRGSGDGVERKSPLARQRSPVKRVASPHGDDDEMLVDEKDDEKDGEVRPRSGSAKPKSVGSGNGRDRPRRRWRVRIDSTSEEESQYSIHDGGSPASTKQRVKKGVGGRSVAAGGDDGEGQVRKDADADGVDGRRRGSRSPPDGDDQQRRRGEANGEGRKDREERNYGERGSGSGDRRNGDGDGESGDGAGGHRGRGGSGGGGGKGSSGSDGDDRSDNDRDRDRDGKKRRDDDDEDEDEDEKENRRRRMKEKRKDGKSKARDEKKAKSKRHGSVDSRLSDDDDEDDDRRRDDSRARKNGEKAGKRYSDNEDDDDDDDGDADRTRDRWRQSNHSSKKYEKQRVRAQRQSSDDEEGSSDEAEEERKKSKGGSSLERVRRQLPRKGSVISSSESEAEERRADSREDERKHHRSGGKKSSSSGRRADSSSSNDTPYEKGSSGKGRPTSGGTSRSQTKREKDDDDSDSSDAVAPRWRKGDRQRRYESSEEDQGDGDDKGDDSDQSRQRKGPKKRRNGQDVGNRVGSGGSDSDDEDQYLRGSNGGRNKERYHKSGRSGSSEPYSSKYKGSNDKKKGGSKFEDSRSGTVDRHRGSSRRSEVISGESSDSGPGEGRRSTSSKSHRKEKKSSKNRRDGKDADENDPNGTDSYPKRRGRPPGARKRKVAEWERAQIEQLMKFEAMKSSRPNGGTATTTSAAAMSAASSKNLSAATSTAASSMSSSTENLAIFASLSGGEEPYYRASHKRKARQKVEQDRVRRYHDFNPEEDYDEFLEYDYYLEDRAKKSKDSTSSDRKHKSEKSGGESSKSGGRSIGSGSTGSGSTNGPPESVGIIINGRKRVLSYSAINSQNRSGQTPIFKFANSGDVETCINLIKAGADLNIKDYAGWTPLHEACLKGHVEVCKVLIQYGADVNAAGGDHDTPLHDAVQNGHLDVVELLLAHGASMNALNAKSETPMDVADDDEIIECLKRWEEMTARVVKRNKAGQTPLHSAAASGDLKDVREYLQYGADINAKDNAGWTPLHEAALEGHAEVVEELLRYGADVDVAGGDNGDTPLMDASANGHVVCVKLLLSFGADASIRNRDDKKASDFLGGLPSNGDGDDDNKAAADKIRELLTFDRDHWVPFRQPAFRPQRVVNGGGGDISSMGEIRDMASEARDRDDQTSVRGGNSTQGGSKHNRRNSVETESTTSTTTSGAPHNGGRGNFGGALSTGSVGSGGWGGTDSRGNMGSTFPSSREERKLQAYLRMFESMPGGSGSHSSMPDDRGSRKRSKRAATQSSTRGGRGADAMDSEDDDMFVADSRGKYKEKTTKSIDSAQKPSNNSSLSSSPQVGGDAPIKRKRGRPRKYAVEDEGGQKNRSSAKKSVSSAKPSRIKASAAGSDEEDVNADEDERDTKEEGGTSFGKRKRRDVADSDGKESETVTQIGLTKKQRVLDSSSDEDDGRDRQGAMAAGVDGQQKSKVYKSTKRLSELATTDDEMKDIGEEPVASSSSRNPPNKRQTSTRPSASSPPTSPKSKRFKAELEESHGKSAKPDRDKMMPKQKFKLLRSKEIEKESSSHGGIKDNETGDWRERSTSMDVDGALRVVDSNVISKSQKVGDSSLVAESESQETQLHKTQASETAVCKDNEGRSGDESQKDASVVAKPKKKPDIPLSVATSEISANRTSASSTDSRSTNIAESQQRSRSPVKKKRKLLLGIGGYINLNESTAGGEDSDRASSVTSRQSTPSVLNSKSSSVQDLHGFAKETGSDGPSAPDASDSGRNVVSLTPRDSTVSKEKRHSKSASLMDGEDGTSTRSRRTASVDAAPVSVENEKHQGDENPVSTKGRSHRSRESEPSSKYLPLHDDGGRESRISVEVSREPNVKYHARDSVSDKGSDDAKEKSNIEKPKKRSKRKSWFGISGYQEIVPTDDARPVDQDQNQSAVAEAQTAETNEVTMMKQESEDEDIPAIKRETPAEIAQMDANAEDKIALAKMEGVSPPEMKQFDPERKAALEEMCKRRCLPLYAVLLPLPSSTTATGNSASTSIPAGQVRPSSIPGVKHDSALFGAKSAVSSILSRPRYMVDLQIGLFLGLKSGRALLERYPHLSRRVATPAEKAQLEVSPLAEAVLSCMLSQRSDSSFSKWIKWVPTAGGGRGMKLTDLDIHFLREDEVMPEVAAVCAAEQGLVLGEQGVGIDTDMKSFGVGEEEKLSMEMYAGHPLGNPWTVELDLECFSSDVGTPRVLKADDDDIHAKKEEDNVGTGVKVEEDKEDAQHPDHQQSVQTHHTLPMKKHMLRYSTEAVGSPASTVVTPTNATSTPSSSSSSSLPLAKQQDDGGEVSSEPGNQLNNSSGTLGSSGERSLAASASASSVPKSYVHKLKRPLPPKFAAKMGGKGMTE
ncbi:hypothetical protein HK102_000173 [Quaeritorhiza haematococci]|nr:hypothetical protein HK102_000173 [Quaeritorhiza haematococci]